METSKGGDELQREGAPSGEYLYGPERESVVESIKEQMGDILDKAREKGLVKVADVSPDQDGSIIIETLSTAEFDQDPMAVKYTLGFERYLHQPTRNQIVAWISSYEPSGGGETTIQFYGVPGLVHVINRQNLSLQPTEGPGAIADPGELDSITEKDVVSTSFMLDEIDQALQ